MRLRAVRPDTHTHAKTERAARRHARGCMCHGRSLRSAMHPPSWSIQYAAARARSLPQTSLRDGKAGCARQEQRVGMCRRVRVRTVLSSRGRGRSTYQDLEQSTQLASSLWTSHPRYQSAGLGMRSSQTTCQTKSSGEITLAEVISLTRTLVFPCADKVVVVLNPDCLSTTKQSERSIHEHVHDRDRLATLRPRHRCLVV